MRFPPAWRSAFCLPLTPCRPSEIILLPPSGHEPYTEGQGVAERYCGLRSHKCGGRIVRRPSHGYTQPECRHRHHHQGDQPLGAGAVRPPSHRRGRAEIFRTFDDHSPVCAWRATVSVFASIAMTGMKLVASAEMDYRNSSIVGLAAALGMGVSQATAALATFPGG